MSLRTKIIAALLTTSFLSLALVGVVAHERLMRRFDDLALARSARNFRGDVASYWLTYGSWDAGARTEPFPEFSQRRRALIERARAAAQPPAGDRPPPLDTGDVTDAEALTPLPAPGIGAPPPPAMTPGSRPRSGPPFGPPPGGPSVPFRFLLFDPAGRVLNPDPRLGADQQASASERARAVPIEVHGEVVAYASPVGVINYSETDLAYRDAVRDALAWGIAAAAALALGLGLLLGTRLSRSARALTRAVRFMQGGALRQRVAVASRDEIGVLADAFNHMSEELARSHDALEASHRMISEQADQLREMAERDTLTKLFNRRHFDASTKPLFEQAARYVRPLAVMIGDIDFFKRVNDRFSHATGDEVLRRVGRLLAEHSRASDVVARYGGEEFVICFPETELDEAAAFCERLRQIIEAHPWRDIHPELTVTMSMGLNGDLALGSVERMLAAADALLYQAKHGGRNRVCHRPAETSVGLASRPHEVRV